jgi:glutamine synthetase
LIPGFEAPVLLAYSARNRSASCRIPFGAGPEVQARRSALPRSRPPIRISAYAAMLMAGLDGIENKIHPGEPMDKDLYALPPEELKDIPQVCGRCARRFASRRHRAFLKKGGVFNDDFIDSYIELKMARSTPSSTPRIRSSSRCTTASKDAFLKSEWARTRFAPFLFVRSYADSRRCVHS